LRLGLEKQGVKFKTQSDTEIVLRLYERNGSDCLPLLRGMFAFAVHDLETGQLFLARDRLGIKPLFYHWDGKMLVGGSEVKTLFASGLVEPSLDPAAVRNYFRYQFAVSPHTVFDSVFELSPGHYMTVSSGGEPEISQYWDLNFPRNDDYESLDEEYWLKEFGDSLDDAAVTHDRRCSDRRVPFWRH